jgi:hypothetical protein
MATKQKVSAKPAASKKAPGTAVVSWQERLAQQAEVSKGMEESTAGGQFVSLKGGILSFNDVPFEDNQMAVIIVDALLENVFYEGEYDPDTPQGPKCFAFAKVEDELKPHPTVVDAGNDMHSQCAGCPMNDWGSADKGKGKACRNTRRLAIIPAGKFDGKKFEPIEDVDHYKTAAIAFMKLPVTSIKGYSTFVKQIGNSLKRPPHGVITKVKVILDSKTQFKVTFEALTEVPDELMDTVMARHDEAAATIDFPYSPKDEEAEAKKPAKKLTSAQQKKADLLAKKNKTGGKKY